MSLFVFVLCVFGAGCSSSSHRVVRTGLFGNSPNKMLAAFEKVRPGMTLKQLEELGFNFGASNVEHLSGPEAMKVIFGDQAFSAVMAAGRLDALLEELNHYEMYTVPFVDVTTRSSSSFSRTDTKKRGTSVRLSFVLKKEMVAYAGHQHLHQYEKGSDSKFAAGLLETIGVANNVRSLVK